MSSRSTPAPPPAPPAAPTPPKLLDCDIVMKGGITSGVVYPLAITELAKSYRFRNIGGTSAGAIAAAATAAAEYSRRHGDAGTGFGELKDLPAVLAKDSPTVKGSTLFALFQPEPRTLPLFAVATAGLEAKGIGKLWKTLPAALTEFAGSAGAGALAGIVVGCFAWPLTDGWGRVVALTAAVLLALLGMAVGLLAGITWNAVTEIPRNRFGLCSGAPSAAYPAGTPALTPWMAELYNRIAGFPVPPADSSSATSPDAEPSAGEGTIKPLTFFDLWGTEDMNTQHDTELQFITTNLTHGRPHRLPYDTTRLYFKPAELREYFPGWVVRWMEEHPREPSSDPPSAEHRAAVAAGFAPMPAPAHLPVVVAARLSLSFPILFSAIPLYAIDYTRDDRLPGRCWFSDGGLCSNFPVHFFDHALPRWPTFDINLRDVDRVSDNEADNFYVVPDNRAGIQEWWTRFDQAKEAGGKEPGPAAKLLGFVFAMVFAAKDWHDNMQTRVPGYRDRVVHISMSAEEGGLNLSMPAERIERLGVRGCLAARKLGTRFSPAGDGSPMTWDNHRWIRFRTTFRLIEEELREMRETMAVLPEQGRTSYHELIHRDPSPSYDMTVAEREACLAWVGRLLNDDFLAKEKPSFRTHPPHPKPVLRIVPPI
jgi:Patatin-like phospholipase